MNHAAQHCWEWFMAPTGLCSSWKITAHCIQPAMCRKRLTLSSLFQIICAFRSFIVWINSSVSVYSVMCRVKWSKTPQITWSTWNQHVNLDLSAVMHRLLQNLKQKCSWNDPVTGWWRAASREEMITDFCQGNWTFFIHRSNLLSPDFVSTIQNTDSWRGESININYQLKANLQHVHEKHRDGAEASKKNTSALFTL